MRLLKFTAAKDGRDFFINPEHVRFVCPANLNQDATRIGIGGTFDEFIVVSDDWRAVIAKLTDGPT